MLPARVRIAVAADAPELAALRFESRSEQERARESFAVFERRFIAWLRDSLATGTWRAAVALEGDRVVGCMYLRLVDTVPVPGVILRAWGYVTHAYVAPTSRNRGAGRAMLHFLIREGEALGLVELQVWPSQRAIPLYVRAGFRTPEQQRAGEDPDEPSYVLPLGGKLR